MQGVMAGHRHCTRGTAATVVVQQLAGVQSMAWQHVVMHGGRWPVTR
jgi:hypothetical protein